MKVGLKDLRNKMAMAFFMLNGLFVVTIFTMQRNINEVDYKIMYTYIQYADIFLH